MVGDERARITAALREATQRTVSTGGRSARVMIVPSGRVTALGPSTLRRYISHPFVIGPHSTEAGCAVALKAR